MNSSRPRSLLIRKNFPRLRLAPSQTRHYGRIAVWNRVDVKFRRKTHDFVADTLENPRFPNRRRLVKTLCKGFYTKQGAILRLLSRPEEEDSLPENPGEVEGKPEVGGGILDDKITRRQAIGRMGGVAAVVVVAAVAGAGGYYYLSSQGAAQTTTQLAKSLNYLGNDIALGQQAIAEFNKETGGTAISSTSVDFFTLAQRLASSGGQGWDVGFTGRIKNIIPSGSIAPITVANLPRWVSGTLETLIVSPETFLSPN